MLVHGACPEAVEDCGLHTAAPTDSSGLPEMLCNLPPFPAVASRIMALAGADEPDLGEIALAFDTDPAFATELLAIANSAAFGLRARVNSVRAAVPLLGASRLHALAVTVALRNILETGDRSVAGVWRHAAACAVIAQLLASSRKVPRDYAYTAGLLHDVGRLAFLKSQTAQTKTLLQISFRGPEEVAPVERTMFGVDHTLAGAWLVKTWGFPPVFHDVCLSHHEPPIGDDTDLLKITKVSCRLASSTGFFAVTYTDTATTEAIIEEARNLLPALRIPPPEALRKQVTSALQEFL